MKQILKLTVLIIALFTGKAYSQNYPEMVTVEGGTFTMGDINDDFSSQAEDMERASSLPTHKVTLKSFKIAKAETTVAQFRAFCNATGRSLPRAPDWGWWEQLPIVNVNYYEALEYCDWLSKETGKTYRLPTEAEWEYAARGGNKGNGFIYSGSQTDDEVAWYKDNSNNRTHTVMQKRANELGIFDMSGNVEEWCSDWFNYDYYVNSPSDNPKGPIKDNSYGKIIRGGSWENYSFDCHVAARNYTSPTERITNIGFRVVCNY